MSDKDVNYTIDVPHGPERFRELLIYVSEKCANDPQFGATMLNKIMFYADMRAYERLGMPLTGAAYFRLDRGPAPVQLRKVRRDLVEESAIEIVEVPAGNYTRHRTVPLRGADVSLFTKGELAIVDMVIAELSGRTATDISEESHQVAWHILADRQYIPYEVAFLSNERATPSDIADARSLNDKHGWGLRV
ncbi:Panacea domain-containing protein [Sphingomonas asaccharolytica]|uniref:Panacea domain-containing protein n=1 Tax=Sphingomonas asaccharolytica TaxID=40681 RepID=UPI00082FEA16|nr:Panacea domain-containing protein [Sphingomonas asaccharolytica]